MIEIGTPEIIIFVDSSSDMMKIVQGNKIIFCGTYQEFSSSPASIKKFLEKLGLNVNLVDWMYSV